MNSLLANEAHASRDSSRSRLPEIFSLALIVLAGLAMGFYIIVPKLNQPPESSHYTDVDSPAADDPNDSTPRAAQLYRIDNQVLLAAKHMSRKMYGRPKVVKVPTELGIRRVLIVPKGTTNSHDFATLAQTVPRVLRTTTDGSISVELAVVVAEGVRLRIDSRQTPAVYLNSSPDDYASITSLGPAMNLVGDAERPLLVSSRVRGSTLPDVEETDGRPFIRTKGGRLILRYVQASDLGYHVGETSGVSWMAGDGRPGTGGAWHSVLERNHFGAYSSQADGLRIESTIFRNNRYYGFDPHTDTINTTIRNSVATGNGRHGIIFSKGCDNNLIESTVASGNGGAGFMIDDGNPKLGSIKTSNNNILRSLVAANNGGAGVIIEGGVGNETSDVDLTNNRVGYWVRNGATGSSLSDSGVLASLQAAVRIDGESQTTTISGVSIDGAQTGLWLGSSLATTVASTSMVVTGTGVSLHSGAENVVYDSVTIAGSGSHPVTDVSTDNAIPTGITVTDWYALSNQSFISRLIEYALHPLAVLTWSIILIPPLVTVTADRLRRRLT